jgi:ketopantoate reductase
MKIVVLGAGAIGLTVAAKLSRVADVHAVARTRHADAVQERGFLMTGIWGEDAYRFSCSEVLPDAWRDADYYIVAAIVEEAYRVAEAEGVALPWETPEAYLEYLRTAQLPATAAHHSSMLQDIAGGKKTEIDFMNGAVAALAEKHGVKAPYNACIAELIRFRERL